VTVVNFDLRDEIAAAGFDPTDGVLLCNYVNDFEVDDVLVTSQSFPVEIIEGVGSADLYPTPAGNGLRVRVSFGSRPRGFRSRIVAVPDSLTPVEFTDLVELSPSSIAEPELADAIVQQFAAVQEAVDALQDIIADIQASDVESVAGLNGAVTAPALKTALSLPADTAATVASLLEAIGTEATNRDLAIAAAFDAMVDGAPGLLDTLGEIATALGDDPNLAATIVSALAGKVPTTRTVNGHALTGDVTVSKSDVGLGSVDDTDDASKPVSTLQAAAIAAAVLPYQKKPDADSWPTYVYGNSYAILSAAYFTAGNHYTQQVAAALGGGAVTSYAIAGKRILDVMSALLNATAITGLVTAPVAGSTWPGVATRNGLVVLDSIINDIGHYPSMQANPAVPAALPTANTKYLDSMTLNYRAALALMSSESRVEQTARTASFGTWTHDSNQVYPSGGSVSFTSANGAYVEFSVTPPQSGPLRGVVFVHGFTLEAAIGTMAQQTISVDGVSQIVRTPSAWERYTGPSGLNVDIGTDCFPVTLPVDGSAHTIRIAHSGTGGHFMYADGLSIPSTDPNPIAVMGGEHAINYTGWTTAQKAYFHANAKVLIPVIKAVVAEFPHAFYVPSTITPNGLWSSDGLHPNDRGMMQRAWDFINSIPSSVRARLESRRLSNLPDGDFDIV